MNSSDSTTTIGTAPPPPGVTPNFTDPESIAYRLILAAALWPTFVLPILALRLYTGGFILRKWHPDDALIVVGFVFALANSVISGLQTHNGAGLHIWDVPLPHFKRFMKLGAIGGSFTYNLATLFIKASILAFYLRFSVERAFRYTVYFVMFVATGYSLANGLIFLYLCQPMAYFWDPTITGGTCVDGFSAFRASAILNVATDVMILVLPIWMLYPLRVSPRKKIGVTLVLMTGGFVCALSIVRLVAIESGAGQNDTTWYYVTNLVYCLCEMYSGIVCACLPSLRAFAKHFAPNSVLFRGDREDQDGQVDSLPLSSSLSSKPRGWRSKGWGEGEDPLTSSTNASSTYHSQRGCQGTMTSVSNSRPSTTTEPQRHGDGESPSDGV